MATEEYLHKFIASGKRFHELPERFRQTVSEEDWRRRVKDFCIHRGYSWVASQANTACSEPEYYDELVRFYRAQKRLFPYHLGEFVCRQLRLTPFKYYTNILYDSMKEDHPYDSIPNFTAADIVRVLGIGRNEYIATMVQAKSKKLMWRMNKGIVKDLLPQSPLNIQIDSWWLVHVVNLAEAEYRQLDPTEATACHIAARPGGARYADLNGMAVRQLYQRGLVWLEVPVRPEDHVSVPPLEGFVSNKTTTAATAADPLETLLYQIFVAASDRVTVAKLADILNVDVATLRVAISIACRLRFCRKLDVEEGGALGSPTASMVASGLEALDLDVMLRSPDAHGLADGPGDAAHGDGDDGGQGGSGIAFVVDAEVTGFLMMGALTPNLTLFEGGRVYGADVIAELARELHASVALGEGFEGEMRALVDYARSLALVLDCIRSCAGGRPIELLRKESLAGMPPPQAFRILSHSYCVVLPITSLAFPPLPLSPARPASPVSYGPPPAAQTPWLQLALYAAAGAGPASLVLAAGQQLRRLPAQLRGATHALLWPWDAAAVRAQSLPVVAEARFLLHTLNEYLQRTPLLVQPLALPPPEQDGAAAAGGGGGGSTLLGDAPPLVTLDVPLPLAQPQPVSAAAGGNADGGGNSGGWNPFESPQGSPGGRSSGAGGGQTSVAAEPEEVVGFLPSGEAREVQLPPGLPGALASLGLAGSLGFVRLLQEPPPPQRADGGSGGESPPPPRWLPLALWLGMPMQPSQLCAAVCSGAAAAAFLDAPARQAQREGQARLAAALAALAAEHGACGTCFAGGGRDDDLGSYVDRPTRNLQLREGGRLAPLCLAEVVEGPQLLAQA